MRKLDIGSSIFWLMISIYICIHSIRLSLGNVHNPGPGFLFFWSGTVLGILSIVVLLTALTTKRRDTIENQEKIFENVNWMKIIFTLISLVAYAILLENLGFLISTFLFITFLLTSIGAKKFYLVILVALVSTFLSYALFELWLHTRLPKGILGV